MPRGGKAYKMPLATTHMMEITTSGPWLSVGAVFVCGVLASWLVARTHRSHGHPAIKVALTLIALVGFSFSGALAAYYGSLIWGIEYRADRNALVLERLAPLPPVLIQTSEIESALEFRVPEHTLFGARNGVSYEIRTKSGDRFWSSPVYSEAEVSLARKQILAATNNRMQRFQIGPGSLN